MVVVRLYYLNLVNSFKSRNFGLFLLIIFKVKPLNNYFFKKKNETK